MMTKILVCGNAQHGKDTFSKFLASYLDIPYIPVTKVIIEMFFKEINTLLGSPYTSPDALYKYRFLHRKVLYDFISNYNKDDAGRLVKDVLLQTDMYIGLRAKREYEATKHLFKHKFWVYNPSIPRESEESNTMMYDPSEFSLVVNSRSLYDLEFYAKTFAQAINKESYES